MPLSDKTMVKMLELGNVSWNMNLSMDNIAKSKVIFRVKEETCSICGHTVVGNDYCEHLRPEGIPKNIPKSRLEQVEAEQEKLTNPQPEKLKLSRLDYIE